MIELNIEPANSCDAPSIIKFQILMAKETEGLDLNREIVTKGVANVFKDPHKGRYYIAKHANEIIASLLTLPEWSDWRNGFVTWIHSVYVIQHYRGKGIFKQMYQVLKQISLEDEACKGLRLYVDKSNTLAQSVYEKIGMNSNHYHLFEWLKD